MFTTTCNRCAFFFYRSCKGDAFRNNVFFFVLYFIAMVREKEDVFNVFYNTIGGHWSVGSVDRGRWVNFV